MESIGRMTAIYARQSVDKKDSISIENQIECCRSKISENERYIVYEDKGYSGKNTLRPKFAEMMNDVRAGKISKVIIYRLDRISRAIIDFACMIEVFDKHNVSIVSYSDPIDTTTPMGRAMISVAMVFAQLERETIQERVRDNYYARGKEGFYLGGAAPFGYRKVETFHNGKKTYTFEPDGELSEVVKRVYTEYATSNISLGVLCARMNQSGLTTNRDKPWNSVALGRMLRNPVYVMADADVFAYLKNKGATMNNDVEDYIGKNGCYAYGERKKITTSKFTDLTKSYVTIALHEGIIDSETWIACQYRLDQNKQLKNTGKGKHTWLSGLLKCGYCNRAVTVVNGYKDKLYITCDGRKMRVCYDRKRTYFIKDIEAAVEVHLLEEIRSKVKMVSESKEPKESPEVNKYKIRLVQIDEAIEALVSKVAMADSTLMRYINDNIEKMDAEKKELLEKINASISKKRKATVPMQDLIDALDGWADMPLEQKKSVAKEFIKAVYITDDSIDIRFEKLEKVGALEA